MLFLAKSPLESQASFKKLQWNLAEMRTPCSNGRLAQAEMRTPQGKLYSPTGVLVIVILSILLSTVSFHLYTQNLSQTVYIYIPYACLSTEVPNLKFEVLVSDSLNIEPNSYEREVTKFNTSAIELNHMFKV